MIVDALFNPGQTGSPFGGGRSPTRHGPVVLAATPAETARCIVAIEPDRRRCRVLVEDSIDLVTAPGLIFVTRRAPAWQIKDWSISGKSQTWS